MSEANQRIYETVDEHFIQNKNKFTYSQANRAETVVSKDSQHRLGVDCSSFVWRGLKEAGYNVPERPFTTHSLFNGNEITASAQKNFDVISKDDARKPSGDLQQGDIILMKRADGNQHVAIFKGYDAQGHIQFVGSQSSTGPAEVTIQPGRYWDGGKGGFEIVGALRAKESYLKPEFRNQDAPSPTSSVSTPNSNTNARTEAPRQSSTSVPLEKGAHGEQVKQAQTMLSSLNIKCAVDGKFGPQTEAAVREFQKAHHLEADGKVGEKTLEALKATSLAHEAEQKRLDLREHPSVRAYIDHAMAKTHELFDRLKMNFEAQHGLRTGYAVAQLSAQKGVYPIDFIGLDRDTQSLSIGNKVGEMLHTASMPTADIGKVTAQSAVSAVAATVPELNPAFSQPAMHVPVQEQASAVHR